MKKNSVDKYQQLEINSEINNLSETDKQFIGSSLSNETPNVNVSGSVNDTYKRSVSFELTEDKQKVIDELKTLTYITPPIKIASLLQTLFADCNTREGHWLYIAQNYNPRAINRVITQMVKAHIAGRTTIQNPAAYFTRLIKFRKKRRSL